MLSADFGYYFPKGKVCQLQLTHLLQAADLGCTGIALLPDAHCRLWRQLATVPPPNCLAQLLTCDPEEMDLWCPARVCALADLLPVWQFSRQCCALPGLVDAL